MALPTLARGPQARLAAGQQARSHVPACALMCSRVQPICATRLHAAQGTRLFLTVEKDPSGAVTLVGPSNSYVCQGRAGGRRGAPQTHPPPPITIPVGGTSPP